MRIVSGVKWNDKYNIGVEVVDKAHKKLFTIVNKLLAMNKDTEKNRHACKEGVKFFKNYAVQHFSEEEAYMKSINYKDYLMHKQLHDNLWEVTLPELELELERSSYSLESVRHFLGVCVGWLSGHIMIEDRAITGKVKSRWNASVDGAGVEALEKAVIQYREAVFQEETRIINRNYNGGDFGKSLYYWLTYKNPEGKQIQVLLGFEEKLIRHSLEKNVGIECSKVGKIVVGTVQEFLQKFVSCVGECFGLFEDYELEKDSFLSRQQFVQFLMTGQQDYSLLFDSGNGYFSFSVKKSQGNKGA